MAATDPLRRRWPARAALGVLRRAGDRIARWLDVPAAVSAPPAPPTPSPAAAPTISRSPASPIPRSTAPELAAAAGWREHALRHTAKWIDRAQTDAPLDGPEPTRKLRVAIRRIRALARVTGPIDPSASAEDRHLRRLARRLGELRDLDLAIEQAAAARALAEGAIDRAALEELAGWLARHRVRAHARAERGRSPEPLAAELIRFAADSSALADDEPRARTLADAAIAELAGELARTLDPHVAEHEVDRLHAMRIAARRLRYAAELFDPCLAAMHREWLARARDVQHAVGAHRDAAVWHELLAQRIARASARGRLTLARGLEQPLAAAAVERERSYAPVGPALARLAAALASTSM